jgi:lysophospholipid acyltransferase (LPLAT)-like uncharacterized protein
MKIRNPKILRLASWLGARVVRGWVGTVCYRYRSVGPQLLNNLDRLSRNFLFAFWHENMLLPACHYSGDGVRVLISTHSDGQLIADIVHRLGLQTVRGSTTRRGTEALRQLRRLCRESHIVITPDGPRGPRRVLQPGIVYLAAKTGMPIVPVAFGYSHAWRAKSWDRFAVPRPFSRGVCVTTPPLIVPRSATPDDIEPYRREVEEAMHDADRLAERWAATGRFDSRCGFVPRLLGTVTSVFESSAPEARSPKLYKRA